jgi:hypothetical protein
VRRRSASVAASAALALLAAATGRPTARASAWCSSIPRVEIQPEQWGFHAGQPYPGAVGSYARGHGNIDLGAGTANGVICQVDRVRGAGERQVILSIVREVIHTSHHATMLGVEGNIMRIHVRVASSTDAGCAVGTIGEATIFASYNGVHEDLVRFSFPAACRDHDHRYTGGSVVTNVPPN